MLRLSATRSVISVVEDQIGNPTSAVELSKGLLTIATRLIEDPDLDLRGIFHLSGGGEASWADFAEAIFDAASHYGRPRPFVRRIRSVDYPTLARRPANSRLDHSKIQTAYGITLPHWRFSITDCVRDIIQQSGNDGSCVA